jgi:adenine-specific DNA-methyltransferase
MNEPKKMELTSMDVAAEKRDELKRCLGQAFPEVFAEGSIDFDQLKRTLGEWADPGKERFGLNWPGKAECMKIIQQPSVATLKPVRGESVNFDETENLFIEGDNLEVLKLLQKAYFGKIKMIYIDPPYNTGNEFIYPDKYAETLETYLAYTGQINDEGKKFSTNADTSGRYHSRWLNMMFPRLYLARNLLKENGVIFVSIDDHELNNLYHVMSDIFGEENFLGSISVVSNLKGRSDDKYFATAHNYLLAFQRGSFQPIGIELPEEYVAEYKFVDTKGQRYRLQGLRKRGSGALRQDRPNMFFPIYVCPKSSEVSLTKDNRFIEEVLPRLSDGADGRWRWGKGTVSERLSELCGQKVGSGERWDVFQIDYLEQGGNGKRINPKTIWDDKEFANEAGTLEVKELFGKRVFDTPKPSALIRQCIEYCSDADDIILDFFAGSASTAQAVFDQNAKHNGHRKFILVQLPEPCDEKSDAFRAGFANIAEIARERIRLSGKHADGGLLLDIGFRSFSLDQSNFRVWDGDTPQDEELGRQIEMHVDHLSDASSAEDVLFELLLKAGFPLTTKVTIVEMAGKQVFSIEDGSLLICLEKNITSDLIDALAEANPLQVICLDEGFKGNDQLKANAVQTFKARAQADESEIVFRTV